ncbi:MAG: hydrogenase maturation protease [Acidobacteriota bacterium]|nr:hydrogenase maturation protease [Acidobacteriota bacterium]
MQPVLIIAYGNALRSDDGVAWHAAELLRQRFSSADVDILTVHQLVPELAERASHAGHVIFIDAAAHGSPGEIFCAKIDQNSTWAPASHRVTPDQIIALCRHAYGVAPKATVVSIAGGCFNHGEKLSKDIQAELPKFVGTVASLVQQLIPCNSNNRNAIVCHSEAAN